MKYTEDNIIGLKLRHKGHKNDDIMAQYTVGYGPDGSTLGLWYQNSKTPGDVKHSGYDVDTINQNIDSGSWIVREEVESYQIF